MIKLKAMLNEAPNTGERIQNLNNRIKVLRDKISATKSPEQKKLFSDRLKNALQSLSNIKKDHSIKAPHRESVVNEAIKENDWKTIYNVFVKFLKANTKALEIRVMMRDEDATKKAIKSIISGLTNAQRSLKLESVNEAPNKLKHTISKKEWSKIPKYNKHIGMDGVHYIMKYDDKIGTYLQGVQIVDESVNEDKGPCWKGYKQVGMKDKGGRQVPNCVPNESVVKEISSKTPKIFVKTAAVEKKIRELMDDRKKAVAPYNSEKDPKKKEILKQILIKLTKQIQGYEKNLIQLRDMEEEYLQQMHADAELDTTGL